MMLQNSSVDETLELEMFQRVTEKELNYPFRSVDWQLLN